MDIHPSAEPVSKTILVRDYPAERQGEKQKAAAGFECVLVDGMPKYQPVEPPAKKTRKNMPPQMVETEVRKFMVDPAFRGIAKSKRRCALSCCPCIDVTIPGQLHQLLKCDEYAEEWKEFLTKYDPYSNVTSEATPTLCSCHFPDGNPDRYPFLTKSDLQSLLEKEMKLRKQTEDVLNKLNEGLQKIFADDQLAMIYDSEARVQKWSDQAMFKALKLFKMISREKYIQIIDLLKIPFPSVSTVRMMSKRWEEGKWRGGENETEKAVHGLNAMDTSAVGDEVGSSASATGQDSTPRKITTTTISIAKDTDGEDVTDFNEEEVEDKRQRRNRLELERRRAKRNPNAPLYTCLKKGCKLWPPKGIKMKTTPMAQIDPVEMEKALKEAREMSDKRREEILKPGPLPLPPSKMKKLKWFQEKQSDMAERMEQLWKNKEAAKARNKPKSKKSASKTLVQAGTLSQPTPGSSANGTSDQLATHGEVSNNDEDMEDNPKNEVSPKSTKKRPRTKSQLTQIASPTRVTRAASSFGNIDFSFLVESMCDDG